MKIKEAADMKQDRERLEPKPEEKLTPDELKNRVKRQELDDDDLDGVAGGEGMDTGKIII